jgi:malate/lactate dehydrogenase
VTTDNPVSGSKVTIVGAAGGLIDLEAMAGRPDPGTVRSGNVQDFSNSDVIVFAASIPFDPGRKNRADFLSANADILRPYFQAVAELPTHWRGHVIVVSNPVDPLVTWLARHARIGRRQVLGYNWNDSLGLRAAIARIAGVRAAQVEAWILGEHGPHCVALFDRLPVTGSQFDLPQARQSEVLGEITQFYRRWASLGLARTTMWSTANGVAQLVELLTRCQAGSCTASLLLAGEYGLSDVSLGMPVRISDGAITEIIQWPISATAVTKLRAAAEVICCQAATLDHLAGSKSFTRSDLPPPAPSVVGVPGAWRE